MSVDTLRETFHINRISTSDLQDFLTAQTYRPEITQAKNHILSLKNCSLQAVCTKPIQQGKSPKYAEKGLKCIKPKNTNDMLVSIDDIDWIDSSTKDQIQKQKLGYGDIVITRSGSGTIGRASIYCYSEEAYTNDHLFVVRPDKADSHYICSFLNSFHGQRLLEAGVSGSTGQLNLSNEHIKSIPLFRPDDKVQKYIGNKVRQAEQLRAWAKSCRGKIQYYFNDLFSGISLDKPEHHHTRVSLDILVPRLNAEFYSDYYMQVEKGLIGRFGKLTTLGRLAPTVRTKTKPSTDCLYKEIGDLDVGKGAFESGTFHKFGEAPNNAQRIFDEGDIAVSTRRPNRGAIAVIEESSSTTFYSVFLARLKPKDRNFGYWLKEFLRHDAGKLLLLQRCTWTTYPVISEDDIESIPVPEIPDHWDFIARLSRKSVKLEAVVTDLITTTKNLVEALIEGQLTEQQLIQAQQALEDGDNSLDQAILSKLSAEGYAIEGATPLFSDVDELYSLLEEAAQAEAEE